MNTSVDIGRGIPQLLRGNFQISSITYLPCIANVVKERPPSWLDQREWNSICLSTSYFVSQFQFFASRVFYLFIKTIKPCFKININISLLVEVKTLFYSLPVYKIQSTYIKIKFSFLLRVFLLGVVFHLKTCFKKEVEIKIVLICRFVDLFSLLHILETFNISLTSPIECKLYNEIFE